MKVAVVVPNYNGEESLPACLDGLLAQSMKSLIIVVENGSDDDSLELLQTKYKNRVEVVTLPKNRGFAGGVNAGIKKAMADGAETVALFNNDAVADKSWLKNLAGALDKNPKTGIVTGKILNDSGEYLDSTGDQYTVWGLPYPRGRREVEINKYDSDRVVFGASGGASLYRVSMLEEIGLFDEDFFAYYEDVDMSFRAQLAGWQVLYEPSARVYHQIGATGQRIRGFTTYQTLKNLPLLLWKNVPWRLMPMIFPRFVLAYFAFYGSALVRGQAWPATKGLLLSITLWPKALTARYKIQSRRKVAPEYINSMLTHDLPPNARRLRSLRACWWRLRGRG